MGHAVVGCVPLVGYGSGRMASDCDVERHLGVLAVVPVAYGAVEPCDSNGIYTDSKGNNSNTCNERHRNPA